LNANSLKVKPILKPLIKRLGKKDGNTVYLALQLLESVVKNCECSHMYVGCADVQAVLQKLALNKKLELRSHDKVLHLIATWATSFKDFDADRYLYGRTFALLLKKGVAFPPPDADSPVFTPQRAGVTASVAPAVSLASSGVGDAFPSNQLRLVPADDEPQPQPRAAAAAATKRGHAPIPTVVLSGISDEQLVDSCRESADLLRQLVVNDADPNVAEEIYESCQAAHTDRLPAIVTRALDAPAADSALLEKALAVTEELEGALRQYRAWRTERGVHSSTSHQPRALAKPSAPAAAYTFTPSPSNSPPDSPRDSPRRTNPAALPQLADSTDAFDQFFNTRKEQKKTKELVDLDGL
jgi:hypothetical protein